MKALVIGGTGLISQGVIKHLLARGAEVTMYNRGQRENRLPPAVKAIHGDRYQLDAFERQMRDHRFDVVIDMMCFGAEQAESDVRAFGGRCDHLIFCSTACVYSVKVPPGVLIDETFAKQPVFGYGEGKLAAERHFLAAHAAKKLDITIIRPSNTYGPGANLIDQLEFTTPAWDRIERGLPVLCADSGMQLYVSTHRDDVGKLFAYAALNPKAFGQDYNATRDQNFTWRDYYRQAAQALGKTAQLVSMPAAWLINQDPERFAFLRTISQYHGACSSEKAKRDVPDFRCEIGFVDGARETLADMRRRGVWCDSQGDSFYQQLIDRAMAAGVEPMPA